MRGSVVRQTFKSIELSNDRVGLAGMIEQPRHIDVVRLAHFHAT